MLDNRGKVWYIIITPRGEVHKPPQKNLKKVKKSA